MKQIKKKINSSLDTVNHNFFISFSLPVFMLHWVSPVVFSPITSPCCTMPGSSGKGAACKMRGVWTWWQLLKLLFHRLKHMSAFHNIWLAQPFISLPIVNISEGICYWSLSCGIKCLDLGWYLNMTQVICLEKTELWFHHCPLSGHSGWYLGKH